MRGTLIRVLSWVLPAAAIAYLGFVLAENDFHRLLDHFSPESLAVAAAAAVVYGAALYLLAFSWSTTLQHLASNPVNLEMAVRIYAFSTFAKYLPGNVFHYAGRQVAAARLGYGQKATAQASAVEIAGHLLVAGALLLALLPFAAGQLEWLASLDPEVLGYWPLALPGAALLGGGALLILTRRGHKLMPVLGRRLLGFVGLLQLSFFILATLLGVWLAQIVFAAPVGSLPSIAFAYLLAWLVGFVTPGAPGGLGVREACLVAALGAYGDLTAILAFAALSRGALLVGEGLFALSGFLLDPERSQSLERGSL